MKKLGNYSYLINLIHQVGFIILEFMKYTILFLLSLMVISCSSASIPNTTIKKAISKISPQLQKCVAQNKAAITDDELITNLHFTMGTNGKPKDILILNENNTVIENDELRLCQVSAIKKIKYTKRIDQDQYIVQPLRYKLR